MDKSSFGGLILAIGGIVAGLIMEGGKLRRSATDGGAHRLWWNSGGGDAAVSTACVVSPFAAWPSLLRAQAQAIEVVRELVTSPKKRVKKVSCRSTPICLTSMTRSCGRA